MPHRQLFCTLNQSLASQWWLLGVFLLLEHRQKSRYDWSFKGESKSANEAQCFGEDICGIEHCIAHYLDNNCTILAQRNPDELHILSSYKFPQETN